MIVKILFKSLVIKYYYPVICSAKLWKNIVLRIWPSFTCLMESPPLWQHIEFLLKEERQWVCYWQFHIFVFLDILIKQGFIYLQIYIYIYIYIIYNIYIYIIYNIYIYIFILSKLAVCSLVLNYSYTSFHLTGKYSNCFW